MSKKKYVRSYAFVLTYHIYPLFFFPLLSRTTFVRLPHPTYLYIYLFTCLSIYLSIYLSVYLSNYLSIHLSIYPSIYLLLSLPHFLFIISFLQLVAGIPNCEYNILITDDGHDGFLLEQDLVGQHIDKFLKKIWILDERRVWVWVTLKSFLLCMYGIMPIAISYFYFIFIFIFILFFFVFCFLVIIIVESWKSFL